MAPLSEPAQYLLRIDDLCPTVHAYRWRRLRDLIEEFGIRPLLAIVPANEDPELRVSPADPEFWSTMRDMQAGGAAIALHGLTHVCAARGRSLLPLHRRSEFAGLPLEEQCSRIERGLALLRAHGLDPMLWVAPRHGFDRNTLSALRVNGIRYLSDGLARTLLQREGITWIPMQLWAPARRAKGLWTICIHPNTMNWQRYEQLRSFLNENAYQFTCFGNVRAGYMPVITNPCERVYELTAMARLLVRRWRAGNWPHSQQTSHAKPTAADSNSFRAVVDTEPPSGRGQRQG